MGRFFKTSLPEFTDKPVLSTAPLELIAATQTAVVDKQAKALDYGTTLINMLAQMPHMKEHDPIIKEKLDEVSKELQGLFQEMDKNPMASHQTLQKALLYGQDLVKELTTGDFKTITDSYNTNNKGLTTNQQILAKDYYAQPTYQASLRKYAANMYDDKGKLRPYEFPYLAPTPDLLGGLAAMAKSIPMLDRIEPVAGGGYDEVKERSEQDILRYLFDNSRIIKQIIDPQLNAIKAQEGYYEDDLAEKYAANYNYDNAIIYDPVTKQYSINEDIEGTTLGNALRFAISQRDIDRTRHLTYGGHASVSSENKSRGEGGGLLIELDENPDGTVVDPVKTSYQNLNSNPDMAYAKEHTEKITNSIGKGTTEKVQKPDDIEAQVVQIKVLTDAIYETFSNKKSLDPQTYYNLLSVVSTVYSRDAGTDLTTIFEHLADRGLFGERGGQTERLAYMAFSDLDKDFGSAKLADSLLDKIRYAALAGNQKQDIDNIIDQINKDARAGRRTSTNPYRYFTDLTDAADFFNKIDTFEELLYVMEKRTGSLGTAFHNEYTKITKSLVPTFNLPGTEYPVALNGVFTEADVANMDKSSIIIKRRINESKELPDAEVLNSLFTKEGINKAQPSISYRGCNSNGIAQYFATIKDENGEAHTFELSDKEDLISKIYGWDFTDIATTPFFDIDNKSQTDALVALWTSKLKEKGGKGKVARATYNAFIDKAADTEKEKAESYIAEQVLDAKDMRKRYLIPKDKLLSADFIDNNTGTNLKDVLGNPEFEKAEIITKKVEYKGITQEIDIIFDENYAPYSVIEMPDGKVYVKQLSSAFNKQIREEARKKVCNIYNTAVLKAQE